MNKLIKYLLIPFGIVLVAWVIARQTGMLQMYRAPTSSNEPALQQGSRFFSSNLKKPSLLDLICFYGTGNEGARERQVFRLCALGGDTVHIKDAILYVNGKNADQKLRLKHFYRVNADALLEIPEEVREQGMATELAPGQYVIILEDEWVARHPGLNMKLFMESAPAPEINKVFNQDWTTDNFGPVVVPAGKMFLLGDNRHNAYDSRYQGFADRSAFLGTVVFKK